MASSIRGTTRLGSFGSNPLDSLRARALFADEMDAASPAFVEAESEGIHIRGARHPLLALGAGGAVPFDLDLSAGERVLLVSGPNAGGKTVFLKTFGLLCSLLQSGVPPPLGAGSRIPFFRRFFAVIGDEQSIDASLSTFGAQARNLAEILREAGDRDLVIFDEIGSATDPAEGGALAAAACWWGWRWRRSPCSPCCSSAAVSASGGFGGWRSRCS